MREETITYKIFQFDELSEEVQQKVLNDKAYINVHHEWWDFIYESFIEDAEKEGFDVSNIYFSGFANQGDGAMFEGKVNKNFKFKDIRPMIQRLIDKGLVNVISSFKHHGHYYHEMSYLNWFRVDYNAYDLPNIEDYFYHNYRLESQITYKYESLCKDLYRRLEKEYEHLTSKEQIIETIKANDYEFYENGKQY